MRNLDASPVLEQPNLVEIKAATVNNRRVSDFGLNVAITRAKTEEKQPGGKPASAKQPGGNKS
jgi:type IV pilus assembly protein PilN